MALACAKVRNAAAVGLLALLAACATTPVSSVQHSDLEPVGTIPLGMAQGGSCVGAGCGVPPNGWADLIRDLEANGCARMFIDRATQDNSPRPRVLVCGPEARAFQ